MALLESTIVFLVSLAVGGLGIHIGTILITGSSDYFDAVVTALIGAVIWSVVGFFIGGIPFLGPGLTFLAWLAVINSRTEGGWIKAGLVALIAWISVIVTLSILASFGISSFEATGIPNV